MKKERYHLLDGIRGIALLSIIAYHGMYDLVELYGVPADWFWKTPGYLWQQGSCYIYLGVRILLEIWQCAISKRWYYLFVGACHYSSNHTCCTIAAGAFWDSDFLRNSDDFDDRAI